MEFDQIVTLAKPDKPDTVQMSFRCPVGLHEQFTRLAKAHGADRTRLLVGAVEGLIVAMENSRGGKDMPPPTVEDRIGIRRNLIRDLALEMADGVAGYDKTIIDQAAGIAVDLDAIGLDKLTPILKKLKEQYEVWKAQ